MGVDSCEKKGVSECGLAIPVNVPCIPTVTKKREEMLEFSISNLAEYSWQS